MPTYVILSKLNESAFRDPEDLAKCARTVADKIESDCPNVTWKDSYATTGRFDVVDIVDAPDVASIERAAMIIRAYGHASTETMLATPWKQFIQELSRRPAASTVGTT
jgi:uncharacterized protein with GYD domain